MVSAVSTDPTPWEYAEGAVIECSPALLQDLRRAAVDGFVSFAHGGLETGGVLYGVREGGRLSIRASAELPCEHAHGPGFLLSDNDRQALTRLLQAPDGLQTVGWYRAHTREGLGLDGRDLELFAEFFAEQKSVGLVLKPSHLGSAAAAFFVREETGEIQPPAPREFTIETIRAPQPVQPVSHSAPREPALPEGLPAPVAGSRVGPAPAPPRFPRPLLRHAGLYLAAGAAALALAWLSLYRPARPAGGLALQVYAIAPGQLRIQWDRRAKPVVDGQSARLLIRDGGKEDLISLDANQLRHTTVTYVQKSSHVSVALRIQGSPGSAPAEEFAEFLGATQPAIQAQTGPLEPAQAAVPAQAAPSIPPKPAPARKARRRPSRMASYDPLQ